MPIDSSKIFDSIRIKPNKLSAKQQAQAREAAIMCEWPGCKNKGPHRAPKGRENSREYWHYCLDHVRDYNARWNYYAGMSADEIEAEIRNDAVWQRPTWPLGDRHGPSGSGRLRDPLGIFSGGDASRRRNRRGANGEVEQRMLSAREQALAVFEIEPPFTPTRLKSRYKTLVKLHHPDAHGGDKAAEEKLKIINQAYATLKASYFS